MHEWKKQIQIIVDEIDNCIMNYDDEALTLRVLSKKLGYSEFIQHENSKKFRGCSFGIICGTGNWPLH